MSSTSVAAEGRGSSIAGEIVRLMADSFRVGVLSKMSLAPLEFPFLGFPFKQVAIEGRRAPALWVVPGLLGHEYVSKESMLRVVSDKKEGAASSWEIQMGVGKIVAGDKWVTR